MNPIQKAVTIVNQQSGIQKLKKTLIQAETCNDYNSYETEHSKDIDEIVPINNAELTDVNY